ncbi:PAS domain S-box protein [Marinilabilia rubra]|nr:PAS domain S-box protein [Marinilabilia rubra]
MTEKWTDLFDVFDDIILFIDSNHHIKKINKKGLEYFNTSEQRINGQKCYKALWNESEPCKHCPFHISQETGKPESTEQYLNLKGGKWFSIKSSPMYDKDGNLEGFADILRDVSDIKNSEIKYREINDEYLTINEELNEWNEEVNQLNSKLKQLNQDYELVSEYSSDLVTRYNKNLKLTFVGNSVRFFTGYNSAEYRSMDLSNCVHPSDQIFLLRFIVRLKNSSSGTYSVQYRFKHKTKGYIWVEAVINITHNKEGQFLIVNHRNINQRKESENELKNSEEKFKALYNYAPLPYQSLDKNGHFLDVNPTWLSLLGYTKEEVIGQPFKSFLHPDSQELFQERFPEFKIKGCVSEVEFKIRHKQQHFLDVAFQGRIGYTKDGEVKQTFCVFRDITEQKEALEKLENREIRLANILKHMTSGVAVYKALNDGEDFEFTNFNDAAEKITKTCKKDVIGRKLLDVFPNMNKSPLIHALKEVYQTGDPMNLEPFFYKDNTREGWRENQIYKLPSGEVVALFTDVTQIIEGQEKLKEQNEEYLALNEELNQTNEELYTAKEKAEESEMEFRELFENMSQGFALHEIILDENKKPSDYRYIHINRAFEKINQIKASDFIGKRVKEVLPKTENYWIKNFGEVAQTGWPMHFENYSVEFDKYYDVIAYSPRKGFFAVIFTDVTKNKKHEQELTAAKQKAEESDRLKSAFLANMSHEIRTPMNAIMGFTELLNNPRITPEKRERYASVIKETGTQLLHIINDILDISKIESGNIHIENSPFQLRTAIEEVFNVYEPQISQKGLKLIRNFNLPSDELIISGDKKRIQQILHNLLSNAFKFTDKGKIEIECSIGKQTLTIKVTDTGRGIKEENVERVFERFWQENTELEENKGGTGLGLPISYQLAKRMNGSLQVTSKKNEGASFSLTLPYVPFKEEPQSESRPAKTVLAPNHAKKRILIAEDEDINFLYLKELLSLKKLTINRAKNGKEAILMALEPPYPDLILMDIKMPVMDGVKAMQKIKQSGIQTSIIALTAYAMKEDKQKYLQLGFDGYISKPVDVDLLFKTIEKLRK